MTQLTLAFSAELPRSAPPLARTTDPGTSWAAGREQRDSGREAAHTSRILERLREVGSDVTYRELWVALGGAIPEAVEVMRRLSTDLAPLEADGATPRPWQPVLRGPKRKCRVSDRPALTWWAREHLAAFLAAGGLLPPGEINSQRPLEGDAA